MCTCCQLLNLKNLCTTCLLASLRLFLSHARRIRFKAPHDRRRSRRFAEVARETAPPRVASCIPDTCANGSATSALSVYEVRLLCPGCYSVLFYVTPSQKVILVSLAVPKQLKNSRSGPEKRFALTNICVGTSFTQENIHEIRAIGKKIKPI